MMNASRVRGRGRAPLRALCGFLGVSALLLVGWCGSAAAANRTITVQSFSDSATNATTGQCTLRMAVERVGGHSNSCQISGTSGSYIISLPAGSYSLDKSVAIPIRASVTIQGAQADNSSTILGKSVHFGGTFLVDSGIAQSLTINIKNLRITNSQDVDVDGGAINILPADSGAVHVVTLDTVQIDHCFSYMGGAINNYGGQLTINNGYFHDNEGDSWGGVVASQAINNNLGNTLYGLLTVTNSRFINNKSDTNGGGIASQAAITSVVNSTFTGNVATGNGGALYALPNSNGASFRVSQSTLNGNTAYNGGGLYGVNGSSVSMMIDTVSANIAQNKGGGLYGENYLELFNLTVAFNQAKSTDSAGSGGGVYAAAGATRTNACIVSDNFHGDATHVADDYWGSPHAGDPDDARSLFRSTTYTSGLLAADLVKNPQLAALAANSATTWTHAIPTTSPAYNADQTPLSGSYQATDQRGFSRPQHGTGDLGAFERR